MALKSKQGKPLPKPEDSRSEMTNTRDMLLAFKGPENKEMVTGYKKKMFRDLRGMDKTEWFSKDDLKLCMDFFIDSCKLISVQEEEMDGLIANKCGNNLNKIDERHMGEFFDAFLDL
jgi:hypothetical protein